jgi:hypothetical protein
MGTRGYVYAWCRKRRRKGREEGREGEEAQARDGGEG